MASRACTIVAANYLVRAAVLAESYLAQHPDGAFTVLVVDDEERRLAPATRDARVDWRRLADLGLDAAEIHRLAGCYDVTELSTAVKPLLLRRLMDEGPSEVVYLDPDIYVYDSLEPVFALAARHGIVLTPHITAPFPEDGRQIDALFVLAAGVYNLGFIAVGAAARPFLDWWWRQTRRHALNDVTRMLFTDQRWVDYVPSLFDHHILKDPGYNVAYWNLHARAVSIAEDGRPLVCDTLVRNPLVCNTVGVEAARGDAARVPLRFFHFSGFDPREPWLLSRHQGERPRVLLSEHPVLAQLCRDYVARLAAAGPEVDERADAYGWHVCAAGIPMTDRVRRVYWRGVMDAEQGLAPEPPDPFDRAQPDRFVDWLNAPDAHGPRRWSRFLAAIYHGRAELVTHFPDIDGLDAPRFADWLWHHGVTQERIALALMPPRDGDLPSRAASPASAALDAGHAGHAASAGHANAGNANAGDAADTADEGNALDATSSSTTPTGPGLTITGDLRSDLGIGEVARRIVHATSAAGLPHATFTRHVAQGVAEGARRHPFADRRSDAATFDINLLCANADQTPALTHVLGHDFLAGRYIIGYWFWEAGPLPRWMHDAFLCVDEVWTATDYMADLLRAAGHKPVLTIPLPLAPSSSAGPATPPALTRARLGLPADRFTFLLAFDFLAAAPRKNPLGLVEAFRRTFAPDEGPVLVLKSRNGALRVSELEQLRLAITGRADIVLIDADHTREEIDALLAACDCYVSLHRAEGLGMTLAEAMALGKPVIATGYSGNRHFMTEENSYLVDYALAPIPDGCRPYSTSGSWAEPDLEHAARLMRAVYEQPDAAAEKGARGRADVRGRHGVEASAAAIAQRIAAIRAMHAAAASDRSVQPEASSLVMAEAVTAETGPIETGPVEIGPVVAPLITPFVGAVDEPDRIEWLDEKRPLLERGVPPTFAPTFAAASEPAAARPEPIPEPAPDAVPLPSVTTAIATLDALLPRLAELATPRLSRDHRRFSGLRRLAQRLMFRAIQPYTFQQRQHQDALIDALVSTVRQLATDVAALQTAMVARQEQGDALTEARAVTRAVTRAEARTETRADRAEARTVARQARTDARLDQLRTAITTRQAHTHAQLAELRTAVARGAADSDEALARLRDRMERLALAVEGQRYARQASDGAIHLEYRRTAMTSEALAGNDSTLNGSAVVRAAHGANGAQHAATNGSAANSSAANGGAPLVSVMHEPLFQARGRLYLPLLAAHAPVLDIGCGRGAMLDLLRAAHLPSFGIDRDPDMVSLCRANGHLVEEADAVSFLRARSGAAGALGAIFSAELPDADDVEAFLELLRLCRARLQPDGLLIAEATLVEGESRLEPEARLTLCQRAGFDAARILFHADPHAMTGPPRLGGRYALVATTGLR